MKKRLAMKDVYGIWAGITMAWDEKYNFDEKTYANNIEDMCKFDIHGVYTTGSTGEFYSLSFDEFKAMVDIQNEICGKYNKPLQIGCCSDSTWKTIRLIEYAAQKENVGGVQVNIPYWMEVTDRELIQFFKDIYSACPDMPLIQYNTSRAKRFLCADDYLNILEVAPSLIGVKYTESGSHFDTMQENMRRTPQLAYMVAEHMLASSIQLGAKGSCSSLIGTNPTLMLKYYSLCEDKKWDEAIAFQISISKFFNDVFNFIKDRGEGLMDPIFDKGLSVAAGCTKGSQRIRPPYIGWSDETIIALRSYLKENYPEYIYPEG